MARARAASVHFAGLGSAGGVIARGPHGGLGPLNSAALLGALTLIERFFLPSVASAGAGASAGGWACGVCVCDSARGRQARHQQQCTKRCTDRHRLKFHESPP